MKSNFVRADIIRQLLTAALLLALSLSLGCSNDDLGEDEAKITAVSSGGIRFANNSRYEVHLRISGSKETKKTLSAYSGSGAYPSYTYHTTDGSSHNVYYSPSSKVRPSGAGSDQIIFYNK